MTVRAMTVADLDWAVERLAHRRADLAQYAPIYWRPSVNAREAHRDFLGVLLGEGGGVGFRTDSALLIAAPGRDLWTIDDAVVAEDEWITTGGALWSALAGELSGTDARFVCPTPERVRAGFARRRGFKLVDSWWHVEIPRVSGTVRTGEEPVVDGAVAKVVSAPPIYDPFGPVLFLPTVDDPAVALPSARAVAEQIAVRIVVVSQPLADKALGHALRSAGFQHHCDFLDGTI